MRKQKKFFSLIVLALIVSMTKHLVICAAETNDTARYDLLKGGTQTFVIEKNGEKQTITIEYIDCMARIADDTYKVNVETSGWTAGFYIKVTDNKISSAYSPFYVVKRGSIENSNLTQNSNVKVTYSFVYKWTLMRYNTGVIATISGTSLKVTQK